MGRGTPLRLPYRHWTEIVSGFGEPDGTPHYEFPGIPPGKNLPILETGVAWEAAQLSSTARSLSLSLSLSLWL